MLVFGIMALVFFAVFCLFYFTDKTRLLNGFLLWCSIFCAGGCYLLFVSQANIPLLNYTVIAIGLLVGFLLLFGVYIIIALLLLNARIVFKREHPSLANSLTLIAALILGVLAVVSLFFIRADAPLWLRMVWGGSAVMLFVYFIVLASFLTSVVLCNASFPRKNQNYIIVLGSGLIDGKVPPLLRARIDRAIRFYHKQAKKGTPPKLVMSGGQGADEPCPEAAAMKAYAVQKGIPPEQILTEEKSRNTLENMQFSRKIMEADSGGKAYRCIYTTNNYHLLRAGNYAKKAGLRIRGIGAKTAFYFLPNALLREYIAVLWRHKICNLLLALALFMLGAFLAL